ncbi:MAG: hypothetical protein JNJ99_09270 [Crocinitomicaceae bacterium]|nr:hypothetical protein [Crocinitomicaceae bacterium]
MKLLLTVSFVLFSFFSYTQVSGEIINDGRKIVTPIAYTISGHQSGKFVFKIAVNMDGKVTSCVLQKDESTIVSTPLMMKAKNNILTGLTFEKDYAFPEFHYGYVTIEVIEHNE